MLLHPTVLFSDMGLAQQLYIYYFMLYKLLLINDTYKLIDSVQHSLYSSLFTTERKINMHIALQVCFYITAILSHTVDQHLCLACEQGAINKVECLGSKP